MILFIVGKNAYIVSRIYDMLKRIIIPLPKMRSPEYDTKLYLMVMIQSWGVWSAPSLPLLSDPLWLGEVVPARIQLKDQIDLFLR